MDEGARTLPEATCRVLVGGANDFVQSECKKEAGVVARHWERVCRRLGAHDGHVLRARTSAGLAFVEAAVSSGEGEYWGGRLRWRCREARAARVK